MSIPNQSGRIDLLKSMVRIRAVEEGIVDRYSEQEMRCPVHLSIGQEAAAVGVGAALRKSDLAYSTHRCHAHYLAKGGDLKSMLSEIYGKDNGCVGGRGGSMHLMDNSVGFVASIPIVSSSIPLAVGSALSDKIDGSDRASVAFFGDAAVEEGVFHESANFAAVKKLPVLFACENNLYSVYTPLRERQPDRPLYELAAAHGLKTIHCDGNDVDAVKECADEALAYLRGGNGPVFLQMDTYRWREHCGPNYDNHLGYRTEEEFQQWKLLDPISCYIDRVTQDGLIDHNGVELMKKELSEEIDAAFEHARVSDLPKPQQAMNYVYSD